MKVEQLQQKLDQANEQIEEFRREQDRLFMLKNELRRMREDDIVKLRERQKRIDDTRKSKIMHKG